MSNNSNGGYLLSENKRVKSLNENKGVQGGMLAGAAIGGMIAGPVGATVGGVIGGVFGAMGSKK